MSSAHTTHCGKQGAHTCWAETYCLPGQLHMQSTDPIPETSCMHACMPANVTDVLWGPQGLPGKAPLVDNSNWENFNVLLHVHTQSHGTTHAQTDRHSSRVWSQGTLSETCWTVSWGKHPREMDCLMMEKAALIMAWLATQAAAVAKTNTNCKQTLRLTTTSLHSNHYIEIISSKMITLILLHHHHYTDIISLASLHQHPYTNTVKCLLINMVHEIISTKMITFILLHHHHYTDIISLASLHQHPYTNTVKCLLINMVHAVSWCCHAAILTQQDKICLHCFVHH
jgi:hypothetical protein